MTDIKNTEVESEHVQFTCTVKYLDTFIESVQSFRDEGKLIFTDEKVFTKVADPANVGMCVSRIRGEALNKLEVNGTDKIEVGMMFEKVRDCISGVPGTSDIEVTYPVSSTGNRLIRLDIIDKDLQFEVSTLEPSTVPDIPDVDPLSHRSQVVVDGSEMKKTISHADKMVDQDDNGILFETYGETLQIASTDKTAGNFKKQFHNHDPSVDESLGEHKTHISIAYLQDIKKVFGKGEQVVVHVKNEHPVRFDIDLDSNGDAKVVYVIAPRLDTQ